MVAVDATLQSEQPDTSLLPLVADAARALTVSQAQSVDPSNTQAITAVDASPGSPWVGTASVTRADGVVGVFLSAISTAPLGGTYTFEFGEDGLTWPVSIGLHSDDFSTIRFRPLLNVGAYFRAQFEPDLALGAETVFLTTQFAKQADPLFVVPAGHVFEESEAAFPAAFSFLKAFFAPTGESVNVRADRLGRLLVTDDRLIVTESGSLFGEGIRDDISLSFDLDGGAAAILHLLDESTGGSVAHDTVEGRVVFSTGVGAANTVFFLSDKEAVYEPGHMIRGEQTIEISRAVTGTEEVRWGWCRDDGAGAIDFGIGQGIDTGGLFYWRAKAGADVVKVYASAANRDHLDGIEPSRFRLFDSLVAFDPLNNFLSLTSFEWLGIAPPRAELMTPGGSILPWHVEETVNQQTGTTVPSPLMRLFVRAVTDGPDLAVASGSWRGGVHTNKTVTTGQQPDGDYADTRSDGVIFSDQVLPFAAGATRVYGPFDSDGWRTIQVTVTADQVSGGDGIVIEYFDDVQAAVPVVIDFEEATFAAGDATKGSMTFSVPTVGDGFQLSYTNGGTPLGVWGIDVQLRVAPLPPIRSLQAEVTDTTQVSQSRAGIMARTSAGVWGNIERGSSGGLDVGVVQVEVPVPIKGTTSMVSSTTSISAATKIIDSTAVPVGATSVEVQAGGTNNQVLYFGESSAKTTLTTAGFELDAGQSKYIDIVDGLMTDLWAAPDAGTQRYRLFWTMGGGV